MAVTRSWSRPIAGACLFMGSRDSIPLAVRLAAFFAVRIKGALGIQAVASSVAYSFSVLTSGTALSSVARPTCGAAPLAACAATACGIPG